MPGSYVLCYELNLGCYVLSHTVFQYIRGPNFKPQLSSWPEFRLSIWPEAYCSDTTAVLREEKRACCFTLKLPSPTLFTRTTPSHLAQALLGRCSGAAKEMIREIAKHGLDE